MAAANDAAALRNASGMLLAKTVSGAGKGIVFPTRVFNNRHENTDVVLRDASE